MSGRVVAVAVASQGMIFTIPAPARHHHVLHKMHDMVINAIVHGVPENQGFLFSDGTFADRQDAAAVAIKAGQIKQTKWGDDLYSEDLW